MWASVLLWIGYVCVALELAWLFWWWEIVYTGAKSNDSLAVNAGYASLTSAHAALVLFCMANCYDIRKNCTSSSCPKLEQPLYMWFFGGLLAIPFDVLQYLVNRQVGLSGAAMAVSTYTVACSAVITLWSIAVYAFLLDKRGEPAKPTPGNQFSLRSIRL